MDVASNAHVLQYPTLPAPTQAKLSEADTLPDTQRTVLKYFVLWWVDSLKSWLFGFAV